MKIEVLLLAVIPAAAWAARFATPQLPPSGFADTEASTNITFSTGAAKDRRWTFSFELDAADVNNAQVDATIPLDDVFRTFQTLMGVTNVSRDAFLASLTGDVYSWVNHYVAGRDGVSPQELNSWYLSLVSAEVPADVCRDDTNMWQ